MENEVPFMTRRLVFMETPESVKHATKAPMICVEYNVPGYWPIWSSATADELNEGRNTVVATVLIGSMFGWDCPGAKGAFGVET